MRHPHHVLCEKIPAYHRWHRHPLHPHVHWGFLGSVVLGVALTFVGLGWGGFGDFKIPGVFAQAQAGADGMTFAGRRSAYLGTLTGNLDPANLTPTVTITDPADKAILDGRVDVLFGWLEKCLNVSSWNGKCNSGNSGAVVEQVIRYFSSGYWIAPGPKAQRGYAIVIPLKYQSVITTVAYNAVLGRYRNNQDAQNDLYTVDNENKLIMSAVGMYLYAEYFDTGAALDQYGCTSGQPTPPHNNCQKNWPSFTYKGVTYNNGMTGNFPVMDVVKGFLIHFIDEWMVAGKGEGPYEFDSVTYHRLFPEAMMILQTYAKDSGMKNRGKMAGDLMVLDALMDFSANSWGGTIGRTDYRHMSRTPRFPLRVLFGLSSNESEWDIPAVYSIGYAPPDLLVALSRFDETWRFHKEYNENLTDPGKGKWDYLTPNYNIGSDVGPKNTGWGVNVKGSGADQFIRFFINGDQAAPAANQEGSYMGDKGNQLRNAMFVSLTVPAKLWEFPNGTSWQNPSTEAGKPGNAWDFRQLNNAYVAIQLKGSQAAVEVADASDGYATFADFKAAVKANASLTTSSFTTSKNKTITLIDQCGLHNPGDCGKASAFPAFDRMETEYGQGSSVTAGKRIDWQMTPNGPMMAVSKAGLVCNYTFGSWTYNGNGCGSTAGPAPQVCTPGAWVDQTCGGTSGTLTCKPTQMLQTRTVNPAGCDITAQCVANAACGSPTPTVNQPPSKPIVTRI